MANVRGYTRRGRRGGVVSVRSYTNRKPVRRTVYADSKKANPTQVWRPQVQTAAVYDPSKPGHPFAGRVARRQPLPKGFKRYGFDNTELGQEPKDFERTEGRTKSFS